MTPEEDERYEIEIYDAARDIAFKHKQDQVGMKAELLALGCDPALVKLVIEDQMHPDYQEAKLRGLMVDEGVYEGIKDCLRPIRGFA